VSAIAPSREDEVNTHTAHTQTGWTEKEGKNDIAVIMLEMRNDLLTDKSWRAAFTQRLTKILGSSEVVDLVKKKKASWAGS